MGNSILYYPTIEFRREDYQWLWNAALYCPWSKMLKQNTFEFIAVAEQKTA